jgi:CxxH/CxxC protein (TIGR04129 family)
MNIKCCEEHADLAMDVIVDELGVAPKIVTLGEAEKLSTTCEYCSEGAVYIVSN